jgi:transcriptional regulator GlxA family with amidase domain
MDTPRDVFFVLLPNVVLLDVAGPADAFRNAEAQRPGSYRLRFVAPQPRLQAAVGLSLADLEPLPQHTPSGSIVVLTGIAGTRIDLRTRPCNAWCSGCGRAPRTSRC